MIISVIQVQDSFPFSIHENEFINSRFCRPSCLDGDQPKQCTVSQTKHWRFWSRLLCTKARYFQLDNQTVLIIVELTIVFSITDIPAPAKCRNFAQGKNPYGGDINPNNPARVLSAVGCAALCETFIGCNHWSYNILDSLCLLKNAASQLRDDPDWVAGACAP